MASPPGDRANALNQLARSLTTDVEQAAAAAGIQFDLAVRRRPTLRGIERALVLEVSPEAGFDDFYLPAFRRTWLGGSVTLTPLEDVELHTRRILAAYIAGEVPPRACLRRALTTNPAGACREEMSEETSHP